jgi:hypothetical protein
MKRARVKNNEAWQHDVVGDQSRVDRVFNELKTNKWQDHVIVGELPLAMCPDHPWSPFIYFLANGDLDCAKHFLVGLPPTVDRNRLFKDYVGCTGRTPFNVCVRYGHLECAKWVLRHDPNAFDQSFDVLQQAAAVDLELFIWVLSIAKVQLSGSRIAQIYDACKDRPYKLEVFSYLQSSPAYSSKSLVVAGTRDDALLIQQLVAAKTVIFDTDFDVQRDVDGMRWYNIIRHSQSVSMFSYSQLQQCMIVAVMVNNTDFVRLLLRLNQSLVHNKDEPDDHCQPLWRAVMAQAIKRNEASVEIASILLEAGASPFLYDKNNVCMRDCLWLKRWRSRDRNLPYYYTNFELDDNRVRMIGILQHYMSKWTPDRFFKFPVEVRDSVKTFLLCNMRLRSAGKPWLIRDCLHLVFAQLAVSITYGTDTLKASMSNSKMTIPVIASFFPDEPRLTRKRKAVLVDMMVQKKLALDETLDSEAKLAAQLPQVIGCLQCVEQDTSIVIPNPTVRPWITVGRIAARDIGVKIDMSFDDRRVSRWHFSIRFNLTLKKWEINVKGVNGVKLGETNLVHNEWTEILPPYRFMIPGTNLSFVLHPSIK